VRSGPEQSRYAPDRQRQARRSRALAYFPLMFIRRTNVAAETVVGRPLTAGALLTGFIHSAAAFERLGGVGFAWLIVTGLAGAGAAAPRAAALRSARFRSFAACLSCFASSRLRFAWLLKLAICFSVRLISVRHANTYGT
jgi:hypothetical protein